ncbi:MAG: hypothetical protein NTX82_01650 [Candidatus Parcubacteria bacterium]|nr:hypothetical protein [Candidatus Parcubacteria bacterium]
MDPQTKLTKVQAIIKRFASKMSVLAAQKNKVIATAQQSNDSDALAQAQEKIKNL